MSDNESVIGANFEISVLKLVLEPTSTRFNDKASRGIHLPANMVQQHHFVKPTVKT